MKSLVSPLRTAACLQKRLFATTTAVYNDSSLVSTYKQAMGGIAASAMVITTTSLAGDEPRGLTLSSITSLSLKPAPLVSFNVQLPSRTAEVLHSRNIFAINVLPATTKSVDLAKGFAGAYGADINPFEKFSSEFKVPGDLPLDDCSSASIIHALAAGPDGVQDNELNHARNIPVISTASAILYCKTLKTFHVQDHEIWVASVFHVDSSASLAASSTLLYQNRAFHCLGPQLDKPKS